MSYTTEPERQSKLTDLKKQQLKPQYKKRVEKQRLVSHLPTKHVDDPRDF